MAVDGYRTMFSFTQALVLSLLSISGASFTENACTATKWRRAPHDHGALYLSSRLDYVHGYHAGNYADIIKHSILILLLDYMKRKESPFVYVETHAGAGSYSLDSRESLQMEEFRGGIGQLLEVETTLPDPLLQLVYMTKMNNSLIYPGSPKIAQELLRSQDSMLLFEKSNEQCNLLRINLNSNATILMNDGYKGLANYARSAKHTPRAIIFIDPPYQFGSDTDQITRLVKHLDKHWKSARLALWYPASDALREKSDRLLSQLKDAAPDDMFAIEMYPKDAIGTGIVLINPPFGITEDIMQCLPEFARILRDDKPTLRTKWL